MSVASILSHTQLCLHLQVIKNRDSFIIVWVIKVSFHSTFNCDLAALL